MEGISISLKMLFNLDFRMTLKEPSARIIIFAGSFMGYLFYAFYTADLTAWMTSNPPPLPIRSGLQSIIALKSSKTQGGADEQISEAKVCCPTSGRISTSLLVSQPMLVVQKNCLKMK